MKKIFLAIMLISLMMACSNNENKIVKDSKLTNDLQKLYSFVEDLYGQTRSESYFIIDNEISEKIFSEINKIWEENNIKETVLNSGYYTKNADTLEIDIYSILQYFEVNSTNDYYDMIISFISGESILLEHIMNNETLLPNEKIGLTLLLGLDNIKAYGPTEDRIKGCLTKYRADVRTCDLHYGWAATMEPATKSSQMVLDVYDQCITDANAQFKKCAVL